MADAPRTHAPRAWIPAAASFAAQPDVLTGLPSVLAPQLAVLPPRPRRVLLVGIGASHAAAASAVHRLRALGIDASRHLPGEVVAPGNADLVVATSQSGRSAEVVELARGVDPRRLLAVTNYQPSPLGDLAGHHLTLGDHADSSVSFLSFTGTLVAFGMLADHWAGGADAGRWESVVRAALDSARAAEPVLDAAAGVLAASPFVDVVAPAPVLAAAEEAALMLREGPLVAATGMETRLYLHGPMDVAGPGAHVVAGGAREALLVAQLAERTRSLLFVATSPGVAAPAVPDLLSATIAVPDDDPLGQAVALTIMCQHLAQRVAERRGVDIDEPVFTRLDTKTATAVP